MQGSVLYSQGWKLLPLQRQGLQCSDTNSGKLAKAMATSADLFIPGRLNPFLVVVACCYSPTTAFGIAGFFLFLSAFRPPEVSSEIHKVHERELWSRDAQAQVQLGHLNKSRAFLNLKDKVGWFWTYGSCLGLSNPGISILASNQIEFSRELQAF